jgi:hypothetical protein
LKVVEVYSHRNGRDILESPRFGAAYNEFHEVLRRLPAYRATKPKTTSRSHIVAPGAMNHWLSRALCIEHDWDWHPLIIDVEPESGKPQSQLRSDFRKARIEVEVQFGNVARYAYDVYKMAIAMALGHCDVGIMVVCTKAFAAITGGNIAYYERAVRELEHSRLTLIVPLAVIGIEPEALISDSHPSEDEAPRVTAEMINAVRRRRGRAPVPENSEVESLWPIGKLRKIAGRFV